MICMPDHRGMFCFHAVSLCFGTAFPGTYFTFACVFIEPVCSHGLCSREEAVSVFSEDMHISEELPVLDLPKLGIAPEHYEAVEKAVKELERQGVAVIIKK